jgi:hypothetical protein
MKRFVLVVIAALVLSSANAGAAPKTIAATEITKIAAIAEHEGATITSQGITIFSNTEKKVAVTSLDFVGAQKWKTVLEGASDQIAMVATADKEGNTWLAGLTSAVAVYETQNAMSNPVNPVNVDGVVVEPVPTLRNDLNCLTLWKVSATGALIATYSDSATAPLLISAISYSSSGISIIGDRGNGTVLINASLAGKFSAAKVIGTSKSSLASIIRNNDGSAQIYGSSSESLGGKKLAGLRDGILAKVNASGALTTVVRSSANRATRSWQSATSTYFLVGDVKVGGKNESAFTKFDSKFSPTWTLRLPSQGSQLAAVGANGNHYALFNSTAAISGVTGWKPSTSTPVTPIVLRFDSKGVITQALKSSQVKSATAMSFISGVGLVVVSPTGIYKG